MWFSARTESDRSWKVDESTWEFPYRYLPRLGVGWRRISLPVPSVTVARPDLLVTAYSSSSFVVGLLNRIPARVDDIILGRGDVRYMDPETSLEGVP